MFPSLATAALNRYLALDPAAGARVKKLGNRVLHIEVTGLGLHYHLRAEEDRVLVGTGVPEVPDATISGGPWAMLALATTDGVRPLFTGLVRIEGDTELAKAYKRLFDTLDIDWEEHLSQVIGDYPAYKGMRALTRLRRWGRRSADSLTEDLGDYLREETRLLTDPYEARGFYDEVDALRADADRLAARVARCQRRARTE